MRGESQPAPKHIAQRNIRKFWEEKNNQFSGKALKEHTRNLAAAGAVGLAYFAIQHFLH